MKLTPRERGLPVLETARLVLREIRVEDVSDAYVAWLNDPEVTRFLELRFSPQPREAVEAFVRQMQEQFEDHHHFGVWDRDGTRLVGTVTAHRNHHHGFAEVSFVIGHPEARGQGYATEAVHALCWYLLKQEGVAMLQAGYYAGHEASARVLAKCGFTEQGRLRGKFLDTEGARVDHVIVGLVAADFASPAGAP